MGLKIRIPKHIWNDYQPEAHFHRSNRPFSKPRLILRLPPAPTAIKARQVRRRKHNSSHNEPTSCKAKLHQFHYGGPHRQQKGKWQNSITYQQPCLQRTCPNCVKWHPHLVRELAQSPVVKAFHDSSPTNSLSRLGTQDIPFRARRGTDLYNSPDSEHSFDRPTCIIFPTEKGKSRFRELFHEREGRKSRNKNDDANRNRTMLGQGSGRA